MQKVERGEGEGKGLFETYSPPSPTFPSPHPFSTFLLFSSLLFFPEGATGVSLSQVSIFLALVWLRGGRKEGVKDIKKMAK